MFQLCLRCGRHEQTGSYCTFCRTAEYDLVDHEHPGNRGPGCPLGPRLDPLDTKPSQVRAFLAERRPVTQGLPRRHHPRAIGYSAESDPAVPHWMSSVTRYRGRSATEHPVAVPAHPEAA